MQTFDERLRGHRNVDSLMDAAEEIVEEMAEEHYEACYDSEICGACTEDTPISGEWGPWMRLKSKFDTFVAEVEDHVERIDGEPYWVMGELSGTYLDAFREAAADPEDCIVCSGQLAGDGPHECGHERYGEDCPAR